MLKTLIALFLASAAFAHVPVVPPCERKAGDVPPRLEDKPLPPVVFSPIPGLNIALTP